MVSVELVLLENVVEGRVFAFVLLISLLVDHLTENRIFQILRALQDLFNLVLNHRPKSLVTSKTASNESSFVFREFKPLSEETDKSWDSLGVVRVSLLQADSTFKCEHEFVV